MYLTACTCHEAWGRKHVRDTGVIVQSGSDAAVAYLSRSSKPRR